MFLRTLLAVLTIAAATSSVPQRATAPAPARPRVGSNPRQLLRGLDPAVPDDIAALAL